MADQLFPNIQNAAESGDLTEIENCYCVNCGKDGKTRMLLTEIPFFRQVVVMSFECPHCNFCNNELQPAQQIAEIGVRYKLKIENSKDLTRQLVKTEWASIKIPEIDFEIKRQTGLVTTVEGILERTISGLEYSMQNNHIEEEQQKQMKIFIEKMNTLKEGKEKFTLILEDISGNSFIENFNAPQIDSQLIVTYFNRGIEENKILGIYDQPKEETHNNLKDEVLQFSTNCPNCNAPCFTNMKLTNIPHFKEVIIMATNCEICGNRTNEVKSGAGIEPKGMRITLKVKNENDLKKDVIYSNTCNITIPELKLTVHFSGSGRYTTVQGLGMNIFEDLKHTHPFIDGDSSREEIKKKMDTLKCQLQEMIGLTIILDDPCGNTYVQDADQIEHYERSWEQNEELGLNDINTEQ